MRFLPWGAGGREEGGGGVEVVTAVFHLRVLLAGDVTAAELRCRCSSRAPRLETKQEEMSRCATTRGIERV